MTVTRLTHAHSRLVELASRHRMTYEVIPEWAADTRWKHQKAGFQIELFGVVPPTPPRPERTTGREPALDASRSALLDVAEWAFRIGDDEVSVLIDAQEGLLVREPSMNAWLVELVGHLLHSSDDGDGTFSPLHANEEHCLRRIAERLSSLGIAPR